MPIGTGVIDTEKFSAALRRRGVDINTKSVLLTRFSGSRQEQDITLPTNSDGMGRIHHFYRYQGDNWPQNPLPIEPAAAWLKTPIDADMMQVQIYQNAICSWRCWYCYVDFELLSGDPNHSEFVSAERLLDLYLQTTPRVATLDLSGGQPDLVPEWSLWVADEIARRGIASSTFLWSDDNLSNDYLWQFLSPEAIERLSSYKFYARVGCLKGFDDRSFAFNTSAKPELFERQFELMRRLVQAKFDVFGYVTLTSDSCEGIPQKVAQFVDAIQAKIHPLFPLRVVPLKIKKFSPTSERMSPSRDLAFEVQHRAVDAWRAEIERRFSSSEIRKPIHEHKLV